MLIPASLWSAIMPAAQISANLAHPARLGTGDHGISETSLLNFG
jgi:hypothetical protein